jgi:hypothetical protein
MLTKNAPPSPKLWRTKKTRNIPPLLGLHIAQKLSEILKFRKLTSSILANNIYISNMLTQNEKREKFPLTHFSIIQQHANAKRKTRNISLLHGLLRAQKRSETLPSTPAFDYAQAAAF